MPIPAPYNLANRVGYALGILKTGRNQKNARRYLAYLATDTAQSIYQKYGFFRPSKEELHPRPIK